MAQGKGMHGLGAACFTCLKVIGGILVYRLDSVNARFLGRTYAILRVLKIYNVGDHGSRDQTHGHKDLYRFNPPRWAISLCPIAFYVYGQYRVQMIIDGSTWEENLRLRVIDLLELSEKDP